MSDLRLETVDVPRIGGTPFHGFAIQVHAALLDAGLCDPRDSLIWHTDGAVVSRVGEQLVGAITYHYYEESKSLWATAAYVLPDWRRRGIFGLMFEELVKVAERRGAGRIEAGSLVSNAIFNKVAVASGMAVVGYTYSMDVVAEEDV